MKTITLLLLLFSIPGAAAPFQDQVTHYLTKQFKEKVELKHLHLKIPKKLKREVESLAQQRFYRKGIHLWRVMLNREVKGYFLLDNVKGRTAPITFGVLFTPEGDILNTTILKYREHYGSAVAGEGWLKRFKNCSPEGIKKVDTISGATISSRGVKQGVLKLLLLFQRGEIPKRFR